MKRFNIIWWVVLAACSFLAHANDGLESVSCYQGNNNSCAVVLKKEKQVDEGAFEVALVDAKSGVNIFPYSDMNDTMENVTLNQYGDLYVFSKEYLDSSKALEFITYKYNSSQPNSIKYYYIESSVDFNNNVKQWSGKECESSPEVFHDIKNAPLLQAASSLCVNKIKLEYRPNKIVGNDVLFNLTQVINGDVKEKIPVIALDSKDSDSIILNDLGCVNNCASATDMLNFIGKINGKFRVKLHLNFKGNDVSGYYFYEKTKKNIYMTGTRNKNKIVLLAKTPEGNESFNGVLQGGEFSGVWSDAKGNKKYPFSLYMMLIQ